VVVVVVMDMHMVGEGGGRCRRGLGEVLGFECMM
jgi:hypothetical protein